MGSFKIIGQKKLSGSIQPQGAKNEALQIISATLLTKEKIIIQNIPLITDVICLMNILQGLGVVIKKIKKHVYSFEAKNINLEHLKSIEFKKIVEKLEDQL